MSVYKRGSIYWFKFTFNGQLVRESTKQTKKRVAEELEAARRTELARGTAGIIKRRVTLAEYSKTFLAHYELRSAERPTTIRYYKYAVARLLEHKELAAARLDAIDETLIEQYIRYRSDSVQASTLDRELAVLRRMLVLAEKKWKLITKRPHVQLFHRDRNREYVLSRADEKRYLDEATPKLRIAALIMLDAGLRVSEAARLRWDDIDFAKRTIRVEKGKSANAKRTLTMTARVFNALQVWGISSADPFVFGGRVFSRSRPVSTWWIQELHRTTRESLGLPKEFVLHSMRHTFGTRLAELGVDVFTIKDLMGHSSVTVSQRYVHPGADTKRRAVSALERSIEGANIGLNSATEAQPEVDIPLLNVPVADVPISSLRSDG